MWIIKETLSIVLCIIGVALAFVAGVLKGVGELILIASIWVLKKADDLEEKEIRID